MKKMKAFKSIRFVFLKFPDSNLFSASCLEFRISIDPVKKSALIRIIRGSIMSLLGFFCTPLVPLLALFVHVSIGIFTYVFLPQTSFLNQYRGFSPFSDFLNFANLKKNDCASGRDNPRLCYLTNTLAFSCRNSRAYEAHLPGVPQDAPGIPMGLWMFGIAFSSAVFYPWFRYGS